MGYQSIKNLLIFSCLLFMGCAASPSVKREAERYLSGACQELFLGGGVGQYQYVVGLPTGRAAFALASDAGGQTCAMATNMSWDVVDGYFISVPNVDKLEALAIQRCEKGKRSSIKAPCRTFARGDEIVWGKSFNKGME